MLIPILFSVFYLLACFGVASAAEDRKLGSQRTFHIAVLLTPLVALLFVYLSPQKTVPELQLFRCKRCGFEFSDKHATCPACAKEGITVFVSETVKREVSLK